MSDSLWEKVHERYSDITHITANDIETPSTNISDFKIEQIEGPNTDDISLGIENINVEPNPVIDPGIEPEVDPDIDLDIS